MTATLHYSNLPEPDGPVCPHCGRCRHCGRGPEQVQPMPAYPYPPAPAWPIYPGTAPAWPLGPIWYGGPLYTEIRLTAGDSVTVTGKT